MRPTLPATTVDLKRGLFMVKCAKSGYEAMMVDRCGYTALHQAVVSGK